MDPLMFLDKVWSVQGSGFGFVAQRGLDGWSWSDGPVRYPGEQLTLPEISSADVYFSPCLFSRPRRRNDAVQGSRWLYADLDSVDPAELKDGLRPTVAWESSPGRYQALWLLSQMLSPGTHQQVNKLLTYKLGADKSGWDSSQVLRLPGTVNHKYDEKPVVKLLWFDERTYRVKAPSGTREGIPAVNGNAFVRVSLDDVHSRAEERGVKVPVFVRSKLKAKRAVGDRSKVLYRLEVELVKAGFEDDEVFSLLKDSVWNKFDDVGLSNDIRRVRIRLDREAKVLSGTGVSV